MSAPLSSDDPRPAGLGLPDWPLRAWQSWWRMFGLRAPLSGDVTQAIDASLVRSVGDQLGFININETAAADPALEQRIVKQVASYGRQLGRLVAAVDVLARRQDRSGLDTADARALDQLQALRQQIDAVKQRSAEESVDRLVAGVRELRKDPEANRAALRRLREALGEPG